MPYRNAHWWIAGLFPLIAIAFWPTYLVQLGSAPFGLHAHGVTATVWLALLAVQSWAIQARRVAWHRAAGLATFVVLPLFAAAGPLALHGMVALFAAKADPFHGGYGARLASADMIAGPSVVALAVFAFLQRRRVRLHAAAMLATALMVLPPILGRLVQRVPIIPADGAFGLSYVELAIQSASVATLLIACGLAARDPAGRGPFAFAALATLAQMVAFGALKDVVWWERLVVRLLDVPAAPMAFAAGAAALALLWWAWRRVPPRATPAGRTGPIAA